MWTPDNPDFDSHQLAIFLLSAWHELFYAFTPDSNQPRLHNIPSLVTELGDLGEWWDQEDRLKQHVQKVQDELKSVTDEELDILKQMPVYHSRLQQLAECESPNSIRAICELLQDDRELYVENFKKIARTAVAGLPDEKASAFRNIRRLATFAFQHGKEDDDVWNPLNNDPSQPPLEIFDQLIALSEGEDLEYNCTLAVVGSIQEIHSLVCREQGFQSVSRRKLPKDYLAKFLQPSSSILFVQTRVQEKSVRKAVASARQQLDTFTGLVNLYKNPPTLRVDSNALVEVNGKQSTFIQSDQAFRRLHPRTHARNDIQEAVDLLANHSIDRRVLAAIELLSLASSSSDPRIRLINLWSAIETLSGAHEGKTTLERVYAFLVPLVISRHVGRGTRYLTLQSQQFGKFIQNHNYGEGFPKENEKDTFIQLQHMLRTLTSPENSNPIVQLLHFAEHPLLRFRIFRTWETYQDPSKLKKMLEKSKKRLKWHIARIYRERNRLVHHGEESPFLVTLLDNLQNYTSMAVQRLIHELKQYPKWNVRNVIQYWNSREFHISNCLKNQPEALKCDDFLESDDSSVLWPKAM